VTAWELVLEARRHGVEFELDGGAVCAQIPGQPEEVAAWVSRLRPHRDAIRALLVEYEPCGTRGSPVDVALAAAVVAAAIGVLSAGGQLCGCCHKIDRCIELSNGSRVCWRCVERSERGKGLA
jgi:hypothetical protein